MEGGASEDRERTVVATADLGRVPRPEAAPSPRRGATALSLRGISKRWARNAPPILADLDLELEPGTLAWIGGPNGAGKTTLLRVASALIEPDLGSVEVEGLDSRSDWGSYQRRIGFLSAGNSGLYARLSVAQHLEFAHRLALMPRSSRASTIEASLARFSLTSLKRRRVDRLSMGQRQRLRLALAFIHRPLVVLLDEPLTSLDQSGCADLRAVLEEHRSSGGSAIWCSPAIEKLFRFDERYVVRDGRLAPA